MKTGTWYVAGFCVAFVYFYVYAVNYIRGATLPEGLSPRAEDIVQGRQFGPGVWSPENGIGATSQGIL